jgi:hypothetical protein
LPPSQPDPQETLRFAADVLEEAVLAKVVKPLLPIFEIRKSMPVVGLTDDPTTMRFPLMSTVAAEAES